MTKRETFAMTLAILGASYDRKLPPPAVEGYWMVLGDLTAEDVAFATKQALSTCKFMPTPAELLAIARPPRSLAADASEAWEAVRGAMDRYDYTTSVDFGPLVNAVVRNLGGWKWLCDQREADLVWRRKDFERVYAELAPKPAGQLHGEHHVGQFHGVPVRVPIGGVLPPKMIAGPPSPLASIVRELAEAKSTPTKEFDIPARPPLPAAPVKPATAPMSEADVAARKEKLAADLAAWRAANPEPARESA